MENDEVQVGTERRSKTLPCDSMQIIKEDEDADLKKSSIKMFYIKMLYIRFFVLESTLQRTLTWDLASFHLDSN